MAKEEDVRAIHIVSHPIRVELAAEIRAGGKVHINKLAKSMGTERRLVSYHLLALEEAGIVTSKYELSEEPKARGKALRVYRLTSLGEVALGAVELAIAELGKADKKA